MSVPPEPRSELPEPDEPVVHDIRQGWDLFVFEVVCLVIFSVTLMALAPNITRTTAVVIALVLGTVLELLVQTGFGITT